MSKSEARCSSCNRLLWTWGQGTLNSTAPVTTKCARCKSVLSVVMTSTMLFARVRVVASSTFRRN